MPNYRIKCPFLVTLLLIHTLRVIENAISMLPVGLGLEMHLIFRKKCMNGDQPELVGIKGSLGYIMEVCIWRAAAELFFVLVTMVSK